MIFDELNTVLDSKLPKWVTFFAVSVFSATCRGDSPIEMSSAIKRGALSVAQCVVEVEGELKLNPDGKQVTKMPFQVRADLSYEERFLAAPKADQLSSTIRYYQKADANLRLGDTDFSSTLRPDVRTVACTPIEGASMLYSPHGQLTREELELIEVQGNSAQLHRVLPAKPVAIGDSWQLSDSSIAALLDLESVIKSEVTATYLEQDKGLAIIELSGTVSGAVGGVSTEIDLKGKCNFDLKSRLVVWLALHIHEDRAIGHAEPGFEVEARIRIAVTPRSASSQLTDELVASLPAKVDRSAGILSHVSESGEFKLLHDRGWHVMTDRHDVTVMRFVDRGDLIAQCNISALPSSEKTFKLDQFQVEVQKALGKNFGQITEAVELQTSRSHRVLRVAASGTASELPIQWIYYHISGEGGKRAAIVYTYEASLTERFGGIDQTMVESFQFQSAAKPIAAREPVKTPNRK